MIDRPYDWPRPRETEWRHALKGARRMYCRDCGNYILPGHWCRNCWTAHRRYWLVVWLSLCAIIGLGLGLECGHRIGRAATGRLYVQIPR